MSKKKIYSIFCLLVICIVGLYQGINWWRVYERETRITFLSVGEGDAILISQGSNQILIDGGREKKTLLARIGRHLPFWDRTIEIVIATHPDADHIGGFAGLFSVYRIERFLSNGSKSQTDKFILLEESLAKNNIPSSQIMRGSTLEFPHGGILSIEYPSTDFSGETGETNKGSIVSRFTYGETTVLLLGDLPSEESFLPDMKHIDILKVSHHGSRYSTSDIFLDQITPREAVISVGKNMYGHPSPDVLKRLEQRSIPFYRTDERGDIQYLCTEESKRCTLVE